MAQFDTVANIVGDVGTELGLGTLAVSYSSTDSNVLQLLKLLTATGRGLVLRFPWLQNKVDYTLTTTTATTYTLPADFQSMVDQSQWNRSTTFPMYSAGAQTWEYLKAFPYAGSLVVVFRNGFSSTTGVPTLELSTAPATGLVLAFEYRSRYWVALNSGVAVTKDAPTLTTDVCRLDAHLLTRALKVAFLRAKGFDSSAALEDYELALDATRTANVGAAPVLSLGGRRYLDRLLDERNAPGLGYGFDGGGLFP